MVWGTCQKPSSQAIVMSVIDRVDGTEAPLREDLAAGFGDGG